MNQPKNKSRRQFLKNGTAGIAGIALLPSVLGSRGLADGENPRPGPPVTRTLGKTGIRLPVVSMGVMNADNPKLVEAALDAGILHLDTAWIYQRGRNEEMIGQVIKGRTRDSFVVATKVYMPKDRKTGLFLKEPEDTPFLEKFETSLKRLGLDHVDILYLHNVPRVENVTYEPYLSDLLTLKKQGRAKFIGVTTHQNEPQVIRATVAAGVYDVILTAYNFRQPHRDEVKKAIGEAARAGLGVVAMKTQAGVYWDEERQHPINMKAALKWVLQDENVHTAIPGFTTFDQMEEDLSVMADLRLTPQEENELKQKHAASLAGLYCAQCRSCLSQCSADMDIPSLMRSYMYAHGYRNRFQAKQTLTQAIDPRNTRLPCLDCSRCAVRCTMGFDVRKRLIDIHRIGTVPEEFLA